VYELTKEHPGRQIAPYNKDARKMIDGNPSGMSVTQADELGERPAFEYSARKMPPTNPN